MKNILKTILASTLVLAAGQTSAQELRAGYFAKSYLYNHQVNPALLEKSYIGYPVLGNINIGTTGNVGLSDFVYKTNNNPNYKLTTFMNPEISAHEFLGNLDDKNRLGLSVGLNVASVAFKGFGGTNLIELNFRSNTQLNLPYELFSFMKEAGAKQHYNIKDLGVRTQNYAELALGHSRAINDRLNVGAKLKFLFGLAYSDLDVKNLDITMTDDRWALNGDARLNAAILKSDFELDDTPNANTKPGKNKVEGLDDVSFGMPGFGMAVDLGATYKLLDGLTLSGSITDLGFIRWKTNEAVSADNWEFDGFKNPVHIEGSDPNSQKLGDQFEQIGDDLERMFSVYDNGKKSVTQGLAATINLGAEYEMPFYRKLSAGFLYTSRIEGIYSYHMGMLSANVRPLKWIEASINTSFTSTGVCWGGFLSLHTKGFNFFVGSDRILGKVSKDFIPLNNANANVCFGFGIPLS